MSNATAIVRTSLHIWKYVSVCLCVWVCVCLQL